MNIKQREGSRNAELTALSLIKAHVHPKLQKLFCLECIGLYTDRHIVNTEREEMVGCRSKVQISFTVFIVQTHPLFSC